MRIAIIGTGISGLAAAYLLNKSHDITVYERNAYIGGHSRTIDIEVNNQAIAVDTGFIVYNERNYPLLVSLFKHLNVPVVKSDMSFGVSIENGKLEYGSKNMLAQLGNIFRPKFWGMIADIIRFNRIAARHPEQYAGKSLGQYLIDLNMGDWFKSYYLQAMGAAIWSCSVDTILSFPAQSFITFFKNHGLLTVNDHPQWYTVKGGSREYVQRLIKSYDTKIRYNCAVTAVKRINGQVLVTDSQGQEETYDSVVFACHADEALALMSDANHVETDILSRFQYQENTVVVHSDTSFMPQRKGAWASWVYLSDSDVDQKPVVSLSYWMNNLQPLKTNTPVIITLNPGRLPAPDKTYNTHVFHHPVFTLQTHESQEKLATIQGVDRYWFCGAYQRYGFHEDGLLSAVNMVKQMGEKTTW